MRVLLVAHHAYIDLASGAARSVRAMLEILAAAGHACEAVTSGRFDRPGAQTLAAVLAGLGAQVRRDARSGPRPIHRYVLAGVEITAVATIHATRNAEDAAGSRQLVRLIETALAKRPDVVLVYGGHPVALEALRQAKMAGARTIFTVRNLGFHEPLWYRHVDRVLFTSAYLARLYAETWGVHGVGIASPIIHADVAGEPQGRRYVTFVNPSPDKGLAAFARLADMLGRHRPDIALLIIESRAGAAVLSAIPGLDLASHPQIVTSLPVDPTRLWSLTRIALMPSVSPEPFGRVAAEAMINGVPVIVSDRGGLPDTVADGGLVLPLPDWMDAKVWRLPTEVEMQPWFDAIVSLWDDATAYARVAAAGRAAATRLYAEATVRRRYLDYFQEVGPFEPVLKRPASPRERS